MRPVEMKDVRVLRIEMFFLVILDLYGLSISFDVNFAIFRNSTKFNSKLVNSYDTFNISSNECAGNNVDHCRQFGGVKIEGNCHCMCSEDRSTFGWFSRVIGSLPRAQPCYA